MKNLKTFGLPLLIYAIFLSLTAHYGYWWINLVIAFCISYLMIPNKKTAFLIHFTILFLLWTVVSIIKDSQAAGVVSDFLCKLTGNIPPFLLYIITGLTGGLLNGWAGYLGSYLKSLSSRENKKQ